MMLDPGSQPLYETRDVNARALAWIALGACAAAALVLLAMAALFRAYRIEEDKQNLALVPMMTMDPVSPPEPHLEVDTAKSFQRLRLKQQERLNRYGWIDRKTNVVHIPIDRAMERIVGSGVPDWTDNNSLKTERKP